MNCILEFLEAYSDVLQLSRTSKKIRGIVHRRHPFVATKLDFCNLSFCFGDKSLKQMLVSPKIYEQPGNRWVHLTHIDLSRTVVGAVAVEFLILSSMNDSVKCLFRDDYSIFPDALSQTERLFLLQSTPIPLVSLVAQDCPNISSVAVSEFLFHLTMYMATHLKGPINPPRPSVLVSCLRWAINAGCNGVTSLEWLELEGCGGLKLEASLNEQTRNNIALLNLSCSAFAIKSGIYLCDNAICSLILPAKIALARVADNRCISGASLKEEITLREGSHTLGKSLTDIWVYFGPGARENRPPVRFKLPSRVERKARAEVAINCPSCYQTALSCYACSLLQTQDFLCDNWCAG